MPIDYSVQCIVITYLPSYLPTYLPSYLPTCSWVSNGNYTGGWLILDKDDPTIIKQKSVHHLFVPTMDYEIGNGIYPVNRNRTIFVTSVVPVSGVVDQFRVW